MFHLKVGWGKVAAPPRQEISKLTQNERIGEYVNSTESKVYGGIDRPEAGGNKLNLIVTITVQRDHDGDYVAC